MFCCVINMEMIFLNQTVTGDKTWVSQFTSESKLQHSSAIIPTPPTAKNSDFINSKIDDDILAL